MPTNAAEWLNVPVQGIKRYIYIYIPENDGITFSASMAESIYFIPLFQCFPRFGEEMRPVKLTTKVFGKHVLLQHSIRCYLLNILTNVFSLPLAVHFL